MILIREKVPKFIMHDRSRLTEYSRQFQTCLKYIEVRSLPDTVLNLVLPESFLIVVLLRTEENFVDHNIVALS